MPALGAGKYWKQFTCLSAALCEAGKRKTLNVGHSVAGKDLLNDNWVNSIINRIIRMPALGLALKYAGLKGRPAIQLIICMPATTWPARCRPIGPARNSIIHRKFQN